MPWLLAGCLWLLLAGTALVRWDIAQRREQFQTDARAAHRLLSQRVAQLDATLAALVLLPASAREPEQRLVALYPELLAVVRRVGADRWPLPALATAEAASRQALAPVLVATDTAAAQAWAVLAGTPDSVALRLDLRRLPPWGAWPPELARDGPARVTLQIAGQAVTLQSGSADPPLGLTPGFVFAKPLDLAGWPITLQVQRATGPAQWPWAALVLLAVLSAAGLALGYTRQQQAREQARATELARVGRVARLNALGELAAGMAHELNQPLTAVMANVQAAQRLLRDAEDTAPADAAEAAAERQRAQDALQQAVGQARRAADVVARLRRQLEAPGAGLATRAVPLADTCHHVLDLLAPALRVAEVRVQQRGSATALADPVALEQIVHNLVGNALHALGAVPGQPRSLELALHEDAGQAWLTVHDNGPGVAAEHVERLFTPFFTTRPPGQGLGLGLSLSRTLAQGMGGELELAAPNTGTGATFVLRLPAAHPPIDAQAAA